MKPMTVFAGNGNATIRGWLTVFITDVDSPKEITSDQLLLLL